MADEIALNVMLGNGMNFEPAFMVSRSTGYDSGNWYSIETCLYKVLFENQTQGRLDYYKGRKYTPIAGVQLIKWKEE